MSTKRKYSGNASTTMSNGEGIKRLAQLSQRRWKCELLGIYADRDKRGKPGDRSVHSLWRACDLRFPNDAERAQAAEWFATHADALKIDLIVDYAYNKRDKLGRQAFGRSWICSRGTWANAKKGDFTGGGSAWATFLHIELGYRFATTENGDVFEVAWRSLPKP